MQTLWQDFRCGIRQLAKVPGFALVAILTLAPGIGASTSIFSVADAVLLRPLPYPHPEQIVRIWEQASDGHRMNLADQNFDAFRAQNNTFATPAVYDYGLSSVSGGSEPVRANWAEVTLLFGISATDPLTSVSVPVLLSLVAFAASYIPAQRALSVDPMTALRDE